MSETKEKKISICTECKAVILFDGAEYHPQEYCDIAKAFPNDWRKKIGMLVGNAEKFEKDIKDLGWD